MEFDMKWMKALALVVSAGCGQAAAQGDGAGSSGQSAMPGLAAESLYNGINRSVMLRVTTPRSFGTVSLVLMDAAGQALAGPVTAHAGRLDLAEKLPMVWTLRQAAYLQMIDNQEPVGSALVLQPMLSRLVPVTEVHTHPTTGQPHSRIVGWKDENLPEMQAPRSEPAPATQPAAATGPQEAPMAERLMSGLRVYPETDVIMRTSLGEIHIALSPEHAPNTAWNFLRLCEGGFYYDVIFHRVVPLTRAGDPFVIQAGDPTGTGDGGPGYWLPLEPSALPHDFGVISMARSDDPDSNGSQFFFCLSREGTARLDGQYCSFGYAVSGARTIRAIAEVELAEVSTGRPVDPPVITGTDLVPAPPRIPGRGRPDAKVTLEEAVKPTRPTHVPR